MTPAAQRGAFLVPHYGMGRNYFHCVFRVGTDQAIHLFCLSRQNDWQWTLFGVRIILQHLGKGNPSFSLMTSILGSMD